MDDQMYQNLINEIEIIQWKKLNVSTLFKNNWKAELDLT